jgi:NitT/TauT family transport system substrate-binding protein
VGAIGAALGLAAVGLVGCSGGSGGGGEGGDGPIDVRVTYSITPATMPAFIAQEQGFFEDNGLNVEMQEQANGTPMIPMAGKQFDFVFTTPTEYILALVGGQDVITTSGAIGVSEGDEGDYSLVVACEGSGISEISQLEGKKVATPGIGGTTHVALVASMKEAGVDAESVTFSETSFATMGDQCKAGAIDAAVVIEPFAGSLVRDGHTALVNPLGPVKADVVVLGQWISGGQWASENQEAIDRFRASIDDALAYMEENEDYKFETLTEFAGTPAEVVKKMTFPDFYTEITEEQMQAWADTLTYTGDLTQELPDKPLVSP